MEEVLLKIIAEIQREKENNNIVPAHVLFYKDLLHEVRVEVIQVLDKLVASGKLNRVNTINDTAYYGDFN